MRNSALATLATIFVLSCLVLPSLSTAASAEPIYFTKSKVVGGLTSATSMEFAPDGRLFVSEQSGRLRVIKSGVLLSTPFVDLRGTTDSNGERGFLGIAFDPNFASNHYVYLYHTVKVGSTSHNRVSRFTANGDVALSGSEKSILDLENLGTCCTNHNGGTIHFGMDGKLYVNVGENGNSSNSQSISNRLGKILRINADGGIPGDNPTTFPGIGTTMGVNRAIWAVGFRNPYTSGFHPVTGRIFVNDVGANAREEIDDLLKGKNYGWPYQEGFLGAANGNYTRPIIDIVHGDSGACAITGGAFYHPSTNTFGSSYLDKYFYADFCGEWVRVLDPKTKASTLFASRLSQLSQPVDLKVGSDGALYVLTRGTGEVWKFQGSPWLNIPFASQSGNFRITFNAKPNMNNANIVVGLSKAQTTAYTDLAAIVRFNNTGSIDVRNGRTYSSAATVAYSAGSTYKFRMVVSIPSHKYSVYVTPPAKSEILLASNYAFRTEQASVTSLGYVGELGEPGDAVITTIQAALSN